MRWEWKEWHGVPMADRRDEWAKELVSDAQKQDEGYVTHFVLCGDTMVVLVGDKYKTLYQCKVIASAYPEPEDG